MNNFRKLIGEYNPAVSVGFSAWWRQQQFHAVDRGPQGVECSEISPKLGNCLSSLSYFSICTHVLNDCTQKYTADSRRNPKSWGFIEKYDGRIQCTFDGQRVRVAHVCDLVCVHFLCQRVASSYEQPLSSSTQPFQRTTDFVSSGRGIGGISLAQARASGRVSALSRTEERSR